MQLQKLARDTIGRCTRYTDVCWADDSYVDWQVGHGCWNCAEIARSQWSRSFLRGDWVSERYLTIYEKTWGESWFETFSEHCVNCPSLDGKESPSSSGIHEEAARHKRLNAVYSRWLAGWSKRGISLTQWDTLPGRQLHRSLSELHVSGARQATVGWNRSHVHCIVSHLMRV